MSHDPYGLSRVVNEPGVLPQRAKKLDPSLPVREGELVVDVESLNIDAASFKQLKGAHAGGIADAVTEIVKERGKMQNPVTGSGGMLIGRVREVHPNHPGAATLKPGDRIATLVSLTLTPLVIDEVRGVKADIDRVDIKGRAILFSSGIYARLPEDLPDTLALAALDVAGAPALTARYVKPGMKVMMLGAGKSGALCLAQARRNLGGKGMLLALDISQKALDALHAIALCDKTITADATRAVEVMEKVHAAAGGPVDLVINSASVPNTEMASILSVRDGGTVIFFSMATSFTSAALGAEGVGKDVTMVIGNGYAPGHAELTLELLRTERELRQLFESRYV
jgi:L-erythro-3,5-diaminohexanoate dehydrogenase